MAVVKDLMKLFTIEFGEVCQKYQEVLKHQYYLTYLTVKQYLLA